MPTYDYECDACGETTEYFQRITEDPKETCPSCGKKKLRRLIGAGSGFIFKGSGFYITDYRSADYKAKAKADTGGSAGSSSTSSGNGTDKSGDSKKTKAEKKPSTSPTS